MSDVTEVCMPSTNDHYLDLQREQIYNRLRCLDLAVKAAGATNTEYALKMARQFIKFVETGE